MGLLFIFFGTVTQQLASRAAAAAEQPASITVSAAISLKDALDEIAPLYEAQQQSAGGVKVVFNYGGSGTLESQIEQGAPVDVFFSAAENYMDQLAAKGMIAAETRRDVAGNTLVLIAPTTSETPHNFQDLTQPEIKIIALGEPGTVPAGMYARQTLQHAGIWSAVEKKIVYAKDVRAVLTYVATNNADAGMVYQTDAKTSQKVRVVALAPENSHDPIRYPAAVLQGAKNPAVARGFLQFVEGPQSRAVFEKYGFSPAEKSAGNN
jgi:molybdate transport system substrate-binding protein